MDIHFPEEAIDYLRRHKGEQHSIVDQINRSNRQLSTVQRLLDIHKPRSMLDIGCGLGLTSTIIAKYSRMNYLGLLDGDGTGTIFHDFRTDALAWNDVAVAGALARANLGDMCKVETFVQGRHPVKIPVDLIVSFKSWGTHYPIETYLPLAAASLQPGGLVIVDLRPDDEIFRLAQCVAVERAGFRLVERAGDRRFVFVRV